MSNTLRKKQVRKVTIPNTQDKGWCASQTTSVYIERCYFRSWENALAFALSDNWDAYLAFDNNAVFYGRDRRCGHRNTSPAFYGTRIMTTCVDCGMTVDRDS